MEHDENVYDSLKHCFGVLEQAGHYPNDEIMGLLVYCFIVDQVFSGPLSEYLDDEGLTSFNKVLHCLYSKGCLINNPDTIRLSAPRGYSYVPSLRITEDILQRITDDTDELRRTE